MGGLGRSKLGSALGGLRGRLSNMQMDEGSDTWGPAELFESGEQGISYDLTDRSTLYQDSARTVLVSANGDPIGSATDLSGNGMHASQATTASKPLFQGYADFDGVDDSWATAAIDLTSTALVTIVLSMRKITGNNNALVIENSIAQSTNNGTFRISANDGSLENYGFAIRGTVGSSSAYRHSIAGSSTNVITIRSDLSVVSPNLADQLQVRINGAAATVTGAGTTGGTVFGNYPFYIGRRAGSSLPLQGRIYRMIVIGRALTAEELAHAESWCADAAGVVLA